MSIANDCRWIFLDHISILISGLDIENERKAIDLVMTKLRSLAEELNIGLLVVSHIKRMKDGEKVQKNSGRGSGSLEQLSDTMIAINKPKDQPDVSLYEVVKNRFSGEVGTACAVKYNIKTGRLTEMADTSGFEVEGDY
jgi:twinkle protein